MIVTDEGSKPEILFRIAQETHAMSQLKIIWKDKNISLWTKIRLMYTLVLSFFLYACETWTLNHDWQKARPWRWGAFKASTESYTKIMLQITKCIAGLRQLLKLMKIC